MTIQLFSLILSIVMIWFFVNYWLIIAVYVDAQKRNIKNIFFWILLTFIFSTFGFLFYTTLTKRAINSIWTVRINPIDFIAPGYGVDKSVKIPRKWLFFLGVITLCYLLYALMTRDLIQTSYKGIIPSLYLIGLIYPLFGLFQTRLDASVGLLRANTAPDGGIDQVDNSLEKHKPLVIGLIILIVVIILVFTGMIYFWK